MNVDDLLQEFNGGLSGVLDPIDRHLGEVKSINALFDNRLKKYNITQNQVEKALGVQARTLDAILNKSAIRVDAINLFKLGFFLGLTPKEFIDLYIQELPTETIGELESTRRNTFLVSNFDLDHLKKSKFISSKSSYDQIEERIKVFFGLDSIYDYAKGKYIPAFSRTKRSTDNLMREFWVRSAIAKCEQITNPNEFDREALVDLFPKIRRFTQNVDSGLLNIVKALYGIGITVIYQPHLVATHIRGATFAVANKPCIAITDLNKNYATLWFALIHELHHVLYDFDEIQRQVFHLTGETDLFLLQEEEANDFAREYLFSKDKTKYIAPHIDNHFLVSNYAKELQIHPCLIYSFYRYDMDKQGKGVYWSKFNDYFPDISRALAELSYGNSFEQESIAESVKYIKEVVFNS